MDTTTSQIRQQLALLLAEDLEYEDFWSWLDEQKAFVTIGSHEQRLLYEIVGRFYEYDRGQWTDEQLASLLSVLVQQPAEYPQPTLAVGPDIVTGARQRGYRAIPSELIPKPHALVAISRHLSLGAQLSGQRTMGVAAFRGQRIPLTAPV